MEPSLNQDNVPFVPSSEGDARLAFGNAQFVFDGCSQTDSGLIVEEMVARILYFAECGYATFLPSFGIVFPLDKTVTLTDSEDATFVIRTVTMRTLDFEKTDEILTSHRLQFPKLLELRDLTDAVYERIRGRMSLTVPSTNHLRKMLRRYWRNFRSCLVSAGYDVTSPDIKPSLGRFFASHNRQGQSEQECFAGSDISLAPAWQKILTESASATLERPVLENSFEMASALLGSPALHRISLSIDKIISSLNYDLSDIGSTLPESIELESYIKRISERRFEVFFVSNGIRKCAQKSDKHLGNECIVKVPLHHRDPSHAEHLAFELARTPTKEVEHAFVYGALLSLASKTGNAPDGSAVPLDSDQELLSNGAIAAFNFTILGQLQKTSDIPFYFKTLVFLHPEEVDLISRRNKGVLVHYLKQKGYHQAFDIGRPSVLNKTFVL